MRKDKPSRTAYKVAMCILTLSLKPGMAKILPPGIVQATEQLLVASGLAKVKTVRWAKSARMLSVYQAFDRLMPGQFEALGHRKAFCEQQVREAIGAGAKQVLVLGAGFDTLCWRLAAEFPAVQFFEFDHPATASPKAKGVEAMGGRDNLHLVAEDLGQQKLVDLLSGLSDWDPDAQSIIIAEGLVMYLPAEAVGEMFRQCFAAVGDGSRIAFSYIPSGADGRPDVGKWTGLMLWLQNVSGEPWLWSIHPANLSSYLSSLGWTCQQDAAEAAQKFGVEHFVVTQK